MEDKNNMVANKDMIKQLQYKTDNDLDKLMLEEMFQDMQMVIYDITQQISCLPTNHTIIEEITMLQNICEMILVRINARLSDFIGE